MWTAENRDRYDRSDLRYESDLTDAEWSEISPLIPPAKPGGKKRTVDIRQVTNGVMYILGTGVSGAPARRICRPEARSMSISSDGPMTARWSGCIMGCT
jgi:hypothetical protein